MAQEEIEIEDGSNDKAYFTMVPNIVLNHSSAVDQALYMQMKRFAGEKSGGGLCTASHRTLMEKLKIGPKALKTSLEYLIGHGWVDNVGSRKVMTPGGPQDVQIYRVNDIWKLNINHYKGANESVPLSKGGDERNKGGDESATTKNNTKTIEPCALEDELRVVKESNPDSPSRFAPAKYPHALEVFTWFPKPQASWKAQKSVVEREYAEYLYDRTEEAVRGILAFCVKYGDMEYFPAWQSPSKLEKNWVAIQDFANRNGL